MTVSPEPARASGPGADRAAAFVLELGGSAPDEIARRLLDAGIGALIVTLHAHHPSVHDALARRPGDWAELVRVVSALESAGVRGVVKVSLWAERVQPLPSLVALTTKLFPAGFTVEASLAAQPPRASGAERILPPTLDALRVRLAELVDLTRSASATLRIRQGQGIPLCGIPASHRDLIAREDRDPDDAGLERALVPACASCRARERCGGMRPWYAALADQPVEPLVRAHEARLPSLVDWSNAAASWSTGRAAESAGDFAAADAECWRALGFAGDAPRPRSALPACDDIAEQIAGAVAARGRRHTEELAYDIGLKPVLYLRTPIGRESALAARYPDHHVEVLRPDRDPPIHPGVSRAFAHVFVSVDPGLARATADVYRGGDPGAEAERLGALMGYPACCSAAFAAQVWSADDSENVLLAAARGEGRSAHPLLNLAQAHLVPFYPCSYACDEADRFAAAVLDAAFPGERGAEERAAIRVALARPTLFFDKGLSLVFDGAVRDGTLHVSSARILARRGELGERAPLAARLLAPVFARAERVSFGAATWETSSESATRTWVRLERAPGVLLPFSPRERTS